MNTPQREKYGPFGARRACAWLSIMLLLTSVACAGEKKKEPTTPTEPAQTEAPGEPLGAVAPGEPSTTISVDADDAAWGAPNAKVTIVAFLDFQCSFCREGFSTLMELRTKYKDDDLRIVFKHLPLDFHELALPSAIAGQAVKDGAGPAAFFQFARSAFEAQSEISYPKLAEWAEEAGLPRDLYNELVGQESTFERVAQDARFAYGLGVDSTPAFFINGRLLPGAQPREVYEQMIGEELAAMNELLREKEWKLAYQERVGKNQTKSILAALLAKDPDDYRADVDGSPVWGKADAPVTIVMFTDFECPFCKRAEATLDLIRRKYPSDVRIVFKHLPLDFHEQALPAAQISAAVQIHKGDAAFFQAAGDIFERSPHLTEAALKEIGRIHGLTERQLSDALAGNDPQVQQRIQKDLELSDDVLARGTPHFFINGKRLSGAQPIERFEALIQHGKERAQALSDKGVPSSEIYAALQAEALSPGLPEKLDAQVPSDKRASLGPAAAPVVVHVFFDFECRFCKEGEASIQDLAARFPKEVRIVWHHFPLDFHERAKPAARVAQLAFEKKGNDGFLKIHGLLFGEPGDAPALSDEDIRKYAQSLGLDAKETEKALTGTLYDSVVDEELALGTSLGIRGTPAYVVGGYLVTGAKPLRYLERVVRLALKDAGSQNPDVPTKAK